MTRIAAGALVLSGGALTVTGVANAMSVPSGTAGVSVSASVSAGGGGLLSGLLDPSASASATGTGGTPTPSASRSPKAAAPAPTSANPSPSASPSAAPSGSGSSAQPVMQQSAPSQRLAETGGGNGTPLLAGGAAALIAGGLVFRFGPRRRSA